MSGFFGVASKEDCVFDLFFGTDYHSHLGTRRAGLAVYDPERGFDHSIHKIENAPFRTKFNSESTSMKGNLGIGCISDFESQPVFMRSHHGTFAISSGAYPNHLQAKARAGVAWLNTAIHSPRCNVIRRSISALTLW